MTTALIPGAGRGSRLGADKPKALVELDGRTFLSYVLAAVTPVIDTLVLVVGPGTQQTFEDEARRTGWTGPLRVVVQKHPSGSADAVGVGLDVVPTGEPCVVVWGDQVGVSLRTVTGVVEALHRTSSGLVLPLADVPTPYVWYSVDGDLVTVGRSRDGDATPLRGKSDVGTFGFRADQVRPSLDAIRFNEMDQPRECDFVYVVPPVARLHGLHVVHVDDPAETLAVNDRDDLERARHHFVTSGR